MGAAEVVELPGWVTLLRAPNPGPMTLDGTNTWVMRAPGAERGVVIDPGPLDEGHLARIAGHGPFHSILITHGHHDHVEGAARLSELLGGTPVRAAEALRSDQLLAVDGLAIQVLDTPGHTADSICFVVECGGEQVVCTGDTVLGRGTTVVAWPDGDLGAYLTSLALLTAYEQIVMLPGHGPVRADCAALAREYLAHREQRLDQVRAAFGAGADSPEAVVDAVYPDIAPEVRFAALWSARAQLEYLRRESHAAPEQLDPL
jgi:glyoxylase-like metal-dependent hydrolase (beta-lactamase superfamily II)